MVDVICSYCKNSYRIKPYQIGKSKYCSLKCKGLAERTEITRRCEICNKQFTHISSRVNKAKYCSNKCRYKSTIGKGTTTYTCKHCNKTFKDFKRLKRVFCSKACVGKETKKTWKPNYTTVRKTMIYRGMIKECQKCGYNEYPKILGVHHIDENRNNNEQNNLIILCPNCHSIAHMKHIPHGSRH